jgi:zinc/manganese transport system permease protein
MFQYDFMQQALIAILLASIIGGIMGYLILLRRLAFAAHGLGHISFSGAALALLVNVSPIYGQFLSTLLAGFLMGLLGNALHKRDVTIAVVLSFMLGLGMLFLHYYQGSSNAATNLLFGDVLGVSMTEIYWMVGAAITTILVLAIILRPLVFDSVAPQLAESKQVSSRLLGIIFMLLVAASVTLVNQIVGALLVFVLLVGPAAISFNITKSFWYGMLISVLMAVILSVLSLICSFYGDLPVSVCLTALVTLGYFISLCFSRR